MSHYIVKPGGIIKKVDSLMAWALWWEHSCIDGEDKPFMEGGRRVARTDFTENGGGYVSTIFLGIDHSSAFMDDVEPHIPILFESMAFFNEEEGHDEEQERYATHEAALAGHEEMLKLVKMPIADPVTTPDELLK